MDHAKDDKTGVVLRPWLFKDKKCNFTSNIYLSSLALLDLAYLNIFMGKFGIFPGIGMAFLMFRLTGHEQNVITLNIGFCQPRKLIFERWHFFKCPLGHF